MAAPTLTATLPGINATMRLSSEERKERLLAEMNARHAVVDRNGTACVATFTHNPGLGRDVVYYSTFADIRNIYSSVYITTQKTDKDTGTVKATSSPLGAYWLNWSGRRKYDGAFFAPGKTLAPNYLNLWQGFAVTPKAGNWDAYARLIREVICSGNDTHYNYLLNWMARAVQFPGEPGQVAVVLRGERGAGKSTFIDMFGSLFGPHYLQISSVQHLTGQFNAHLETCALLFLDEAFWAGDHSGEGTLKALITERTIAVRPMRTNMYQAPNCLHIMMATNSEWAFPAGPKERRALVLDVSSDRIPDSAFYEAIHTQMRNGGLEALLHDLLARDVRNFNVRKVPQTDALREQQVLSLPPTEHWWHDKLMSGEILAGSDLWPTEISTTTLHEDYIKQTGLMGIRRKSTQTTLGMFLRKYVKGIKKMRNVWVLPSLADARAAWDEKMRTVTEWEDEQ